MGSKIQFEINHIPKTLNEALRSHWTVYKRESEKIEHLIVQAWPGRFPVMPMETVAVTIERHSSGTLDRDNKFFTAKHILDGLVRLAIIDDDKEENIKSLHVNQVKIKRGEPRKLVVTIEEIE